ncbi:MAG: ArsR family transcriptional regulator, arsenate/arsenite/antimonite-responsive transcriptional [Blastocatellia bacterium]|jgi:ArsR family transcriptional regulator|nr:ArsR family transcriptional regulator, arsenate/arsenite/antimonite-responsive transcriptional [Blastocatellia bacterium]
MAKKTYNIEFLFKALADRTRLRLIGLIGDSEVCVCFLVVILKISQPKISRHLAYLRRAGMVTARREGKWMHYRLTEPPDEHAARIFREVRAALSEHPELQRDREKLMQVCCAPSLPVQLRRAPKPLDLAA